MGLFCAGTLSEKEGPIWHPSVTPELLPVCRGQSMRPAAVFIYRRGRPVLRSVEKSEPASSLDLPAEDHRFQFDLQHSLLFFFSTSPKDRLTTSHFFCTHTPSASGLCRPLTGFSISTKWQWRAPGVVEKRLKSDHMSSWKMEHCLPFSLHSTFLGRCSFFIPNVEKLFSPYSCFLAKLQAWAALARALKKKEKNSCREG